MREADLPSANELRALAGWNQTEEDSRRLLGLAAQGCFVATEANSVIGTVTTTSYGADLAWIGMMLVHPEHRRKGVATKLMNCALEYLRESKIQCIKLDATPAGRPLYEQLGFRVESSLTRWQRPPCTQTGGVQASPKTREAQQADWPALAAIDSTAFGVRRDHLLKTYGEAAGKTLVWPNQGPVLAWGLLRAGAHSDYLGPLEGDGEGLPCLVADLLSYANPRSVLWDIPDEQAIAINFARRLGFEPLRPLTRMCLGSEIVAHAPETLFGIVDPAVG